MKDAWDSAPFDKADIRALKAMGQGEATEEQQRRVIKWIVNSACGTYKRTFDPAGDRETAFREGRRFVGTQIMRMLSEPLTELEKEASNG